jgi:Protein of unknown function (DUF992)
MLAVLSSTSAGGISVNDVIGVLTCSLGRPPEGEAGPASHERPVLCSFRADSGGEEIYSGTLHTLGQDALLTNAASLMWVVRGPGSTPLRPGLLGQTYAGAASDRQAVTSLVGQDDQSVTLLLVTRDEALKSRPRFTAAIELQLKTAMA